MKFTANAGELAAAARMAALAIIDPAVAKLQSLAAARIATLGEESVSLTVNTMGVCISAQCAATVEYPGAVAVSATKLSKLAEGFPTNTTVVLAADDSTLVIRGGRAAYKLQTLPLEDLPAVPAIGHGIGGL
jgi:DNA polymerase III sliding clamp (beta) subunit (PCNA family)